MTDSHYTILGSSAGVPQGTRGSSGYVVQVENSLALIDCGGSVTQNFLRHGFDPTLLDRIFITHSHPDHVVELPLLIQLLYLGGRKNPVDLYLPEEFVDPFERMIDAMYLFRSRFPFELRIVGYEDGFSFSGQFSLRAVANSHLRKYAPFVAERGLPSRMQSFSFDMVINGKRLFHSGDVGGFEDVEPFLPLHEYAVLEAAHLDLDRLFSFCAISDGCKIILTHLQSEIQVAQLEQRIQDTGIENMVVASDGFRISL